MGRKSRYNKWKAVNSDLHCTKQRNGRQESHFNRAPKNEDFEQQPPKSFVELMDSVKQSQARAANIPQMKRKNDGNTEITNKKKPKYQRRHWESDDQFLSRVDRMVTGIVNKEKMEILKSGGDKEPVPKKLTKEKERKLKRLKKHAAEKKKERLKERQEQATALKNEQLLEKLEEDILQDKIEFGDVAMEPPVLTKAPRKSKDTAKPGQRELLLKELVNEHPVKIKKTQKLKPKKPSEGKKRKDMTTSEKHHFDQRRHTAIEAYRKHKNTQRLSLPTKTRETPG